MSVDVLQKKIRRMKNPSMVALEPVRELIPPHLIARARDEYGDTLKAAAEAGRQFCLELLEGLVDLVPAVCFRQAAFAALGWEGLEALQALLRRAAALGYYVLLDLPAGVPGAGGAELAEAICAGVDVGGERCFPYVCDGVTLNAYCGSDAVRPYLPYLAGDDGKNLFILARTVNRSAGEVQDLISGDRVVHTAVADLAMRWSTDLFGSNGYSQIAVSAGANNGKVLEELRRKYDRLFLLVSGYGESGSNAKNASYAFDRLGHGAIVCAGGSVTGAWRQTEGSDGTDYLRCARAAAERMRKNILNYITVL